MTIYKKLLDDIFKPEHLNKNYSELLTLAEKYLQDEVTPAMVDRLEQVTREQSQSRNWFRFKTGRITASWLKQVLHTDPHQPSLSLLKSVCYPAIHRLAPNLPLGAVNMKRRLFKLMKHRCQHYTKG